jgi:type 1 glutamine amidotransferase
MAWSGPARVVYIQLGHGTEAHRDAGYRTLVRNALMWVSGRLD